MVASDIKELKQTVSKLKAANRRLKKDKEQLIRELQSLKAGFKETINYVDDKLANIPVEDIVRYFKRKNAARLNDVQARAAKSAKATESSREETKRKFQQWIKRRSRENIND